jgi:hypothetical protein
MVKSFTIKHFTFKELTGIFSSNPKKGVLLHKCFAIQEKSSFWILGEKSPIRKFNN